MNALKLVSALALATALSACGGEDLTGSAVTVSPPPPPPVAAAAYNVEPCLSQTLVGASGGRRMIDIMIPDAVTLDTTKPASWPNGRRLDDPVIDRFLSGLFLSQSRHTISTLVNIPLNSTFFDQPLRTTFPYYAKALGTPPLSPPNGSNFNFRTEPVSQFVKVERVASPAVSTVNILSPRKNAYNDSDPQRDVNLEFRNDIRDGLANLTALIADDLQGLGLTICATPV